MTDREPRRGPARRVGVALGLAASLGAAGCFGPAVYYVAVGGSGGVPAWNGRCDPRSASPAGKVELGDGWYKAVAPGDVRLRCESGRLQLSVRAIHTLSLEGPAAPEAGRSYVMTLVARDAEGTSLLLGQQVDWALHGPLQTGGRCDHVLGSCLGQESLPVIATGTGPGTVIARVAGKEARCELAVRPAAALP